MVLPSLSSQIFSPGLLKSIEQDIKRHEESYQRKHLQRIKERPLPNKEGAQGAERSLPRSSAGLPL